MGTPNNVAVIECILLSVNVMFHNWAILAIHGNQDKTASEGYVIVDQTFLMKINP